LQNKTDTWNISGFEGNYEKICGATTTDSTIGIVSHLELDTSEHLDTQGRVLLSYINI
jgi:hypothetical protein